MSHRIAAAIILLIVIACGILTYTAFNKTNGSTVEIYADGKLVRSVSLRPPEEIIRVPIERDGCKNVVIIENGKAYMAEASCPDKLCIKQGAISGSAYPIVCLPNKVIIKITGSSDAPDAVSR